MKSILFAALFALMSCAGFAEAAPPISNRVEGELEQQIHAVYRDVLGRDADDSGLDTYRRAIEHEGKDLQWLRTVLRNSEEARRFRSARYLPLRSLLLLAVLWAGIVLVMLGIGRLILHGFAALLQDPQPNLSVSGCFWAGFSTFFSLGFFWSLFGAIQGGFAVLAVVLGLLGAGDFLRRNSNGLPGLARSISKRGICFAVAGLCLCFVFLIQTTAAPFTAYDTVLYHWSAVRWLRTHPAVPGLANLHIRLGTNSAWFLFAAAIEQGPFQASSAWILPGLFPAVLGCQLVSVLFNVRGNSPDPRSRLFAAAMFPYLFGLMGRTSPGLYFDDAAQCAFLASVLACFPLLRRISSGTAWKDLPPAGLLGVAFPAAVSFVIKPLGAVWLGGIGLFLLWFSLSNIRKAPRLLGVFALGPGALLCVWMLRNAVLTGWLLFPAAAGGLPVDWRVPEYPPGTGYEELLQSVQGQRQTIRAWAIEPGPGFVDAMESGWREWGGPWFARNRVHAEIRYVLPAALGFLCLFFCRCLWKPKGIAAEATLLLLFVLQAGFWFHMAPDLRFGYVFIHLVFAWTFAGALCGYFVAERCKRLPSGLMSAGAVLVLAVLMGKTFERVRQISSASLQRSRAAAVQLRVIENGQTPPLQVYVPVHGDQTGDSPLPATPYPRRRLLAREPGNPRAGFRVRTEP